MQNYKPRPLFQCPIEEILHVAAEKYECLEAGDNEGLFWLHDEYIGLADVSPFDIFDWLMQHRKKAIKQNNIIFPNFGNKAKLKNLTDAE